MLKNIVQAVVVVLPWPVKRRILTSLFAYDIDPSARIGYSWVYPDRLEMGPNSRIGHLNYFRHLDSVQLLEAAHIGSLNWITGFSKKTADEHFAHRVDRRAELSLGRHSAVTSRHLIDCTDRVYLGEFSTIAGYYSQILTHSIDLEMNRQDCRPIIIEKYTMIGTSVIILPGSRVPRFSIVGGGSVVRESLTTEYTLYAGAPAKAVKKLDPEWGYFNRTVGNVL